MAARYAFRDARGFGTAPVPPLSIPIDGMAVASGILHSISNKITHLTSRVAIKDRVLFTGGVSANSLIREILSKKLKCRVMTHKDSQFAGAIGAAIIGFK